MNLYIKLFLFFGFAFGLYQGIKVGISDGVNAGLVSGISKGLFFGLLMSFFVGKWHKRKTRKAREETGEDIGPVQTKSSLLDDSIDNAFRKSVQSLTIMNARITVSDLQQGTIDATTRMSWKSFGENLKVRLKTNEEGGVDVAITSKPRFPVTLVDYGKGRQNVDSFVKELMS